jgi:hypothetical protein
MLRHGQRRPRAHREPGNGRQVCEADCRHRYKGLLALSRIDLPKFNPPIRRKEQGHAYVFMSTDESRRVEVVGTWSSSFRLASPKFQTRLAASRIFDANRQTLFVLRPSNVPACLMCISPLSLSLPSDCVCSVPQQPE